jgi:hypothetical protein
MINEEYKLIFFNDKLAIIDNISEIKFKDNILLSNEILLENIEFIKANVEKIIYIKYKTNVQNYFLNCKLNNYEDGAIIFINFMNQIEKHYYINDIRYLKIDWLKHPEKIRYDRNIKLKQI